MKKEVKDIGIILVVFVALVFLVSTIVAQRSVIIEVEEGFWEAHNKLSKSKETNFQLIRNNKELEKDIGVWIDKSVELQKESNKKSKQIVEVIPKVKPGVVHISTPQRQGSGFVIAPNLIMTARHCVENIESFGITTHDGHKLKATRAISNEKHDIAFIYVDDLTCVLEKEQEIECNKVTHKVELYPLKLGSIKDCKLGQEIITIGSPYGKVNFNSVTLGIISGLDRNYDELNDTFYGVDDYGWSVAFQTDSPGHPGNSGCAVFTSDGIVRGILVGSFSPSLIIAMPVDIFLEDIEAVKLMFKLGEYYFEEEPEFSDYDYMRENWQ